MAQRKRWDRYSIESLSHGEGDPLGRIFLSPIGQENHDLVHFLHHGIDTAKQLYNGTLRAFPLEVVETAYDAGFRQVVEIEGYEWLIGSGRAGGYRYTLRNSDLGVIVLLGSNFVETDKEGSHLKIELSPHYLIERSAKAIQQELDKIAYIFLECAAPSGVALHLASDFQGWEPPSDFEQRFITRAKRQVMYKGIDSFDVDLKGVSAIYGDRETFMYGSASALQFCMYRKDKEIIKSDKKHFWEPTWKQACDDDLKPTYTPDKPVWRVELRFHHKVLQEFSEGINQPMSRFIDACDHLNGLWKYGLDSYRLDATRTYIDSFWQLLQDDVIFSAPAPDFLYKRVRKAPGVGGRRNVAGALGNLLSVYAKNGFTAKQALHYLKNSGMWNDLLQWQWDKQMGHLDFFEWLQKELAVRRLLGKAA